MSTTSISINLDPFYQIFLYSFFNRAKGATFYFPKKHDLELYLSFNIKEAEGAISTIGNFKVEIPIGSYQEISKSFIPLKIQQIFETRVRDFFLLEFHSVMSKLDRMGIRQDDSIYSFIEKYNLPDDEKTFERLKKDFYRWRNKKYYHAKKNNKKSA